MYYITDENKRICFYNKNGDWIDDFELCEIEYNIMLNNYPAISELCKNSTDEDIENCHIDIYIVSDDLLSNDDIKKYKKHLFQHKYVCLKLSHRKIFENIDY